MWLIKIKIKKLRGLYIRIHQINKLQKIHSQTKRQKEINLKTLKMTICERGKQQQQQQKCILMC